MYNPNKVPFWYSEYADGDLTIYLSASEYEDIVDEAIEEFNNRTRDGVTWITNHTTIYDIKSRILTVIPQENGKEFIFGLETKGEDIGLIDTTKTFIDQIISEKGLDSSDTIVVNADFQQQTFHYIIRKGSTGKEVIDIVNDSISGLFGTNVLKIVNNCSLPYLNNIKGNAICLAAKDIYDAQNDLPLRFTRISNKVQSKDDYLLEDTVLTEDCCVYSFETFEDTFNLIDENGAVIEFPKVYITSPDEETGTLNYTWKN